MEFKSINPYNLEVVATYEEQSKSEIENILERSDKAFKTWRTTTFAERAKLMKRAGEVLRENAEAYGKMITLEMGKPITEAKGEVKKCAVACDYYADNAEQFLADEMIETDATKSFVRHEPIGCVFAVMPWNFPFWQVFRYAAPTLMAGNVCVLKHAGNVFGSALLIEEVFKKAGFPEDVFQNIFMDHDKTEDIISNPVVKAITLTGSERAGSSVAALAGKYIKKSLLELGGSNSFIVWADADLDATVKTAVNARMMNAGQSCIAAKRFIIVEEVYDAFVEKFVAEIGKLKAGDPMHDDTTIGPLARVDLAEQLQKQVQKSVEKGADLLCGGKQTDAFHEPTILGNVTPGMAAFDEETFGPLAAMIKAKNIDHAFELSEQSKFGLGVTVCTENTEKALTHVYRVSDGAYFINELVKSDPRLPFGGTKTSGYGRELCKDGILEFVNRKTVYLK